MATRGAGEGGRITGGPLPGAEDIVEDIDSRTGRVAGAADGCRRARALASSQVERR